ncbi:hypothetical protein ACOSQ3_031432 [Xanthoceras sorbifolium]
MSEMLNEGALYSRPPYLTKTDYPFCKGRMRAHLMSIDDYIWMSVENTYTPPSKLTEDSLYDSKYPPTVDFPEFFLNNQLLLSTKCFF